MPISKPRAKVHIALRQHGCGQWPRNALNATRCSQAALALERQRGCFENHEASQLLTPSVELLSKLGAIVLATRGQAGASVNKPELKNFPLPVTSLIAITL